MKQTMRMILLCLVISVLAGCSYKGVYDGIQTSKQNECAKLPSSQYGACMEKANKSYDEYERERKESLSE